MDPVGTTLGAVSLCIQLVDGIAKGYQFYMAAVNMPARCASLRAKLGMEYQRLLSWAEAAGLLEYEQGQELPEILKTNKLVLVGVLTQMRTLIHEFAEMNGEFQELNDPASAEVIEAQKQIDLVGSFQTIFDQKLQVQKKREHIWSSRRLMRAATNAKAVVTNPRRLRWVAFDDEVFVAHLSDLAKYNDYLIALLEGQRSRALIETTRNTFLEVVAMRSSIEQLKVLIAAASVGQLSTQRDVHNQTYDEQDVLSMLAQFKAASILNDHRDQPHNSNDSLPSYEDALGKTGLVLNSLQFNDLDSFRQEPKGFLVERPLATLRGSTPKRRVWIEWKHYTTQTSGLDLVPRQGDRKRTNELVALLKMKRPQEFCIPECLGFFDGYPVLSKRGDSARQFGIVFEYPSWAAPNAAPQSLFSMISNSSNHGEEPPSLEERITIASKIALCIQYLHAVQWLHKGIRSDSIVFFSERSGPNLSHPFLCSFDFARPDQSGATTTGNSTREEAHEIYRHPEYQGKDGLGHYRKTFDIYSLGIVLLELALWQPIYKIMGFEDPLKITSAQQEKVRQRILDPGEGIQSKLRARVGAKYAASTFACITGCAAFGLKEEDELDSELAGKEELKSIIAVKLQRAFVEQVTRPLCNVFRP